MNRRDCLKSIGAAGAVASLPQTLKAVNGKFAIDYVLASTLYGDMKLSRVLPEQEYTGCLGLDIWSNPYGAHRAEIDRIGVDEFAQMVKKNSASVRVFTCYDRGCFGLQPEMPVLKRLSGKILVSGSPKAEGLSGKETRAAVLRFIEKMIPHADAAGEHGLTIAIANLSNHLLSSPDSIRYFAEFNRHPSMGLAFAPHHLKDHINLIPELILELGRDNLPFVYFQEYGDGAYHQLQKQIELEQLPGRGPFDYLMLAKALKLIRFKGIAEICMHTTPRGLPIMGNTESITELINESRIYVDSCVAGLS